MEDVESKENDYWMKRMHNLYVKAMCKKYNVSPHPYLYPINNTSHIIKMKRSKDNNDKV
jgi:hypothetical protein